MAWGRASRGRRQWLGQGSPGERGSRCHARCPHRQCIWAGVLGVGAGFCREGAICCDNCCWDAFTQQPACLGRQYLKNSIKTWTRGGRGSSAGEAAGLPRPARRPTPLLHPLDAELALFLAGSPSLYLTWIPPAVISVKVDSAVLCLSFSGCRLAFALGHLRVPHSSSTLSRAPHPSHQIQIALYWEERFCRSRQGWTHPFPPFLEV